MTNLRDTQGYPASQFGDLDHLWRIEQAFERLKHCLNLEHVSGLSQQAVTHDLAAKVLCDKLQALAAIAVARNGGGDHAQRRTFPHRKAHVPASTGGIDAAQGWREAAPINDTKSLLNGHADLTWVDGRQNAST